MSVLLINWLVFSTKDISAAYYPSTETLQNGTTGVSGTVTNLGSNDNNYRVVRSYAAEYAGDYQTAVSENETTSTASNYDDKTTLTWNVPSDGNYFVYATSEIKRSSTTAARTSKARLTIDGTTYGEVFLGDDTDVDSYKSVASTEIIFLTAGSHTIKIQLGSSNSNNTAYMKNARVIAFRIGTKQFVNEPADSTTSSTSYTDIASITISSDASQKWMIFAQSEVTNSGTTYDNYTNLMIGSTQYAENIVRNIYANHYIPSMAIKTINLDAGSTQVVKIQMKRSGGTLTYRNVKLYALPEKYFSYINMGESEGESTINSATPTDKTSLSFIPPVNGDYLIIGTGEIATTSNTVYSAARLSIGSTIIGTSLIDVASTTAYTSFSISKVLTLDNSEKVAKIQFHNQTGTTTVKIRNARIQVIKMAPVSKFRIEAEYQGSSNLEAWSLVNWSSDAAFNTTSVGVSCQLYNYNSASYVGSGDGFMSYTSSSQENTEENMSQTINNNPMYFRDSSGNWKIKITAEKSSPDWFDLSADMLELSPVSNIVSVVVEDGVVSYGVLQWGGSTNTLTEGVNDHQIVRNDGNVAINTNIRGQNSPCPWSLDVVTGINQYIHQYSLNNGGNWTNLTTSNQTLANNLGVGETKVLDLQIFAPYQSSCTNSQDVSVTIQASQV